MKTGPKFKIAKRLGAPIYEKTQTQKFALSEARGANNRKRFSKPSDYKRQLLEKQKMRFTYGLSERQFRKYVDESMKNSEKPIETLFKRLEFRLDNVVYRLGLAKTRQHARQVVTHGHVAVNGRRLNIPSHKLNVSDTISVKEGSLQTGLYVDLKDTYDGAGLPSWLSFDIKLITGKVTGEPTFNPNESYFDPEQVLEYYSR